MCAFKPQSDNRSSSPSPAGLVRRYRAATDSEAGLLPWGCRRPSCHAGGGRTGWERSSFVSPFERSGITSATTHLTYRNVVPEAGHHEVTHGRGSGNDHDHDDHDDHIDDHDDDWMCDDASFDSEDARLLNPEELRKSSWFRDFLARFGKMNPEEVTDPALETLCPACKGGPRGSLWYRGFHALLDHASSVTAKRVWLHRRLAEILREELRNLSGRSSGEGFSVQQATAADDKWRALGVADDRMIPWPPMVVVLNTRLGKQEGSHKWMGMGNRELIDCFKEYEPFKAKSAYSSHGHCGVSVLIFYSSVLGYHQAKRLHNHLKQERRGKYEWHKKKPWKHQTTDQKSLLYGYMATKEDDLKVFNTHGDKHKLKYEMKSYQEVIDNPLKEMHENFEKQVLFERKIVRKIKQNKDLDEKLCQCELEIEAIRRMLTIQSDEHNTEIESMNEYCERLSSKLKTSEIAREKMKKQLSSSPRSGGDDQDGSSSTVFRDQANTGDEEHDRPEINEMDEAAEEYYYLGTRVSE